MPINWDSYNSFLTVDGDTYRDRVMNKTKRSIDKRASRSPAYKTVLIDGVEQNVVITSTANLYEKKINALPDEHIYAGSIVDWNDRKFIINYTDCEDEIYQRATMQQCNVILKWQDTMGAIQYCYGASIDISQFASGVVENKILNSIETVYKVNIPMTEETIKFKRGKRFLLDVTQTEPHAYIITKVDVNSLNFHPNNIDSNYVFDGQDKIMQVTLTQTQLSEKDNKELMIADYFDPITPPPEPIENECIITYFGKPQIKMGGNFKTFDVIFYDINKEIVTIPHNWNLIVPEGLDNKIISEISGTGIKLKAPDLPELLNIQIKLEIIAAGYNASLFIKVVNLYG